MDNLLLRTLVALADAQVRFVVCGGVACVLQGVARATHDLDIFVVLDDADLRGVVDVARSLGLTPRVPEPLEALCDADRRRAWVEERNAVVYTLLAPSGAFSVDIFLRYPLTFDELDAAADRFDVNGRTIRVSTKEHLIAAKRAVRPPRPTDLRDIADLEALIDASR